MWKHRSSSDNLINMLVPGAGAATRQTYVAGVCCMGALALIYLGIAEFLRPAYRIEFSYLETPALVLETAPGSTAGGMCRPMLRLRYTIGDTIHESWCRLDWTATAVNSSRAAEELQAFPTGMEIVARYDPHRPDNVVVYQNHGWVLGALVTGVGVLGLILVLGIPAARLLGTARRHQRLAATIGRVIGGRVCEAGLVDDLPGYRAVLFVVYHQGGWIRQGKIAGELLPDRRAAAADLRSALSTYPLGQERPIWYHPREAGGIVLDRLTFHDAWSRCLILLVAPLYCLLAVPLAIMVRLCGSFMESISQPPSRQKPSLEPAPDLVFYRAKTPTDTDHGIIHFI
jgi:Protein of unknown function (DUF3592)